jgi:hypothetical protein
LGEDPTTDVLGTTSEVLGFAPLIGEAAKVMNSFVKTHKWWLVPLAFWSVVGAWVAAIKMDPTLGSYLLIDALKPAPKSTCEAPK